MPGLHFGGTEMQMLSIIRSLHRAGYTWEVCCYYGWDERVLRLFEDLNVTVTCLNLRRSDGLLKLIGPLRSFFKTRRGAIVHVQYLAPALVPIIIARSAFVSTLLATVHTAGSHVYKTKHKIMLRLAAMLCDCFICVSRRAETFWFGTSEIFDRTSVFFKRKHYTIYNGVDVAEIQEQIERYQADECNRRDAGRNILGFVGRISEEKGVFVLIEALNHIICEMPDTVLVVAGDGPDREQLDARAKVLGISGHIKWLGTVPQEQVYGLYGQVDIVVVPSLIEGFGLTAAEAMAAALPVVGTRTEGLLDLVEDGITGYLVAPGDSAGLAARIIDLLKDREKRGAMGRAGNQRVKDQFSVERFRVAMHDLYTQNRRDQLSFV